MKRTLFVGSIILGIVVWGCDNSTDSKPTGGTLGMSSKYTTAALAKSGQSVALDSIKVTRARFVLRDIKFKSPGGDSSNFRTAPMILELNLNGAVQTVGSVTVPFGSYSRIEYDVHRVEKPEISNADSAQFAEFLAGERYSIIINGIIYNTGAAPDTFTYRSKVDAKQKVDFDPAIDVSEAAPAVNATVVISSANWFKNQTGVLVNPKDTNNEGVIDENLKASIKVYKDNNKDGSKDN
ncbi:MAG: hypothetical protein HYV29_00080 [Ignavibacteriales bacterium]|nr:hypothetical protein [Ignavibacteriales bacterium]